MRLKPVKAEQLVGAFSLLANDSDPDDSDVVTVSAVNGAAIDVGAEIALASGALLTVTADGAFTYDPNARFERLAAGERASETFTYTLQDNYGETDTATVAITVLGANDEPTAADDSISINEDTVLVASGSLLSNDTDPDGSDVLTVTSIDGNPVGSGATIALASGALLTIEADGGFSLDPNGRFDGLALGQTGLDGFTYTVNDGNGGTDTANVSGGDCRSQRRTHRQRRHADHRRGRGHVQRRSSGWVRHLRHRPRGRTGHYQRHAEYRRQ